MQTFDQHLLKHLRAGRVTFEEAMQTASSPHDFKLMVAAEGKLAPAPAAAPEPEPDYTANVSAPAPAYIPPAASTPAPPPPSAPPPGMFS
jgi:twitching motility protein PilT